MEGDMIMEGAKKKKRDESKVTKPLQKRCRCKSDALSHQIVKPGFSTKNA